MNGKKFVVVLAAALAIMATGCGEEKEKTSAIVEATPTPVILPTATPTVPPVTVTPIPTSTPAPRMIGTKTAVSKYIFLTNNASKAFRELYLRQAGNGEWGNNLIPTESSIKELEQVQLYYGEGADLASDQLFEMKLVDKEGNVYTISNIELGDMEKAVLRYLESDEAVYISYLSLKDKKEKDTRNYTVTQKKEEVESEQTTQTDYSTSSYNSNTNDHYGYYDNSYYNGGNTNPDDYYEDVDANDYYEDVDASDYYEDDNSGDVPYEYTGDYGDDSGEDVYWDVVN